MKRVKLHISIFAALALLLPFSCAPTLEVSTLEAPEQWLYDSSADGGQVVGERWWQMFQDTTLNRLVESALSNNRDLSAAVNSVESALLAIKVNRADYLPSLSMDVTAEVERYNWEGRIDEYFIEPTLTWELPLFGALKSTNKKSRAEAMASEWALKGVQLSVASQVVTTYFNIRQAQASLEVAQQSCRLRKEQAALIDSMSRYGFKSGVELQQALSLVYSAEADITIYSREEQTLRLSLSLLLGEMPSESTLPRQTLTQMLNEPPLGAINTPLPSQLLERRWDVQQSLQQCESAAAAVGLARSARFPSLSLTASGGLASESIKGLTEGKPWALSVAGVLSQPLYNFGALKSAESAKRSQYQKSLMEYEQSSLQAISEVEQALVSLESYATERTSQEQLVEANRLIRESVGALYQSGMEDYLNVIDAERELYDSQRSLVQSITSQRLGYVTLCKALGGGY